MTTAPDATAPASGAVPDPSPSISDMLDHSAIAPLLHMPIDQVMSHLQLPTLSQILANVPTLPSMPALNLPSAPGLSTLPAASIPSLPPLPGLPALPTVSLPSLIQPLVDMRSGFGTGSLESAAFDPTQLFDGIVQAFNTVTQLGSQALSTLLPLWTGPAAQAAAAKAAAASANGTQTSGQSADISTQVKLASAAVAKGAALLQGVMAKFAASAMAIAPTAITPFGQAALIGLATESIAEGSAIVAETQAEIAAHAAVMMSSAEPILITALPEIAAQLPGMASTVVNTAAAPVESFISKVGGGTSASGLAGGGAMNSAATQALNARSGSAALASSSGGSGSGTGLDGLSGLPGRSVGERGGLGGLGLGEGGAAGVGALGGLAASSGLGAGAGTGTGSGGAGSGMPIAARAMDSGSHTANRGYSGLTADEEASMRRGPVGANGSGMMPMNGAGLSKNKDDETYTHLALDKNRNEVVGDMPIASPTVLGTGDNRGDDSADDGGEDDSDDNDSGDAGNLDNLL